MRPSYILLDIEGTVAPISFVHDVLFPYSRRRLAAYVETHAAEPLVQAAFAQTRATVLSEEATALSDRAVAERLLHWLDTDRKHPALKSLQGMIWREGYESGAFTSVLYPDVKPQLTAWKERGLKLGIYSSGSVQAQQLLFKYTDCGDLTPLFSDYFDTAVGGKRDASSYARILQTVKLAAPEVLFLSDIAEELTAAKAAGLQAVQIVRPGTAAHPGAAVAEDLSIVDHLLQ